MAKTKRNVVKSVKNVEIPVTDQVYQQHKEIVHSFKSRFDVKKKWYDRLADLITVNFGTLWFLGLHLLFFAMWVLINVNIIPGFIPFDPYPFGFLTMVVSLEAIFLAIIVQISINRQAKIAELREEIDFNINVRSEREITKILNMLVGINSKLGLNSAGDDELDEMKQMTDLEEIENELVEELDEIKSKFKKKP
jgi:uncharacterized membrane protein